MVAVVAVAVMIHRLELNVAGKFHDTIGTAVGNGHATFVAFVMLTLVMMLVAGELVEAFHADTLHLVSGALGGGLGFVDADHKLGEDATEDAFTSGIWGVRRSGDGGDGMKCQLESGQFWFFR